MVLGIVESNGVEGASRMSFARCAKRDPARAVTRVCAHTPSRVICHDILITIGVVFAVWIPADD